MSKEYKFTRSDETVEIMQAVLSSRRRIGSKPIEDSFDMDHGVDGFFDAYTAVAEGIHNDVQTAHLSELPLPHMKKTATTWCNGREIGWKTEFLVNGVEPDYIKNYHSVRNNVYWGLLNNSLANNDFGLLLSTVSVSRDPILASMFLKEMNRGEVRMRGLVAGNVEKYLNAADDLNQRRLKLKKAVAAHALRERNHDLRKKLLDKNTSSVGSILVGMTLRSKSGVGKYIERSFYEPLSEVAALPRIEVQLLEKEKAGLSILQD